MTRRSRPANRFGCKPDGDVCLAHDMPLEDAHGCQFSTATSGFLAGPGFKAFADDFPPGTTLIVTARIELPVDTAIQSERSGEAGK